MIVEVIDPDDAIFGLQADCQVVNEAFLDAEAFGDAPACVDVVDLVALNGQAAMDSARNLADVQFQGSNSSSL